MRKGGMLLMVVLVALTGGPLLGDVLFQDDFTGTTGSNISTLSHWSDAAAGTGCTRTIDSNKGCFFTPSTGWVYSSIRADIIEGVAMTFNPITPTGCRFEQTITGVNTNATSSYAAMHNLVLAPVTNIAGSAWNVLGERVVLAGTWNKSTKALLLELRFCRNDNTSTNTGYVANGTGTTVTVDFAAGQQIRLALEVRDDAGKNDVRFGYQIYNGSWGTWTNSTWFDPTNATYGTNAFKSDWKTRWYANTYHYIEDNGANNGSRSVWIDDVTVTGTADTAVPPLVAATFQSSFTGTDGAAISSLPEWVDSYSPAGTTKTLESNHGKFAFGGSGWPLPNIEANQMFNPLTSAGGRFEADCVKINDSATTTGQYSACYLYVTDRDGWNNGSYYVTGEKVRMSVTVADQRTGLVDVAMTFINCKATNDWHLYGADAGVDVWAQRITLNNFRTGTGDHIKMAVEFRDSADNKTIRGGFSIYNSATATWSDWVYSGWYDPTTIVATVDPANPTTNINYNAFDADWKTRWTNMCFYIEGSASNGFQPVIWVDDAVVKAPIGDKGEPDFGAVTFQSSFTGPDGNQIASLAEWLNACTTAGTTRVLAGNQGKFTFDGAGWVFSSIEAKAAFNPTTATGGRFETTCLKIDNTTATATTYAFCSLNVTDRDGWTSGSYYQTGEKIRMYAYINNQAAQSVNLNLGVVNRKEIAGDWHQYGGDSGVDVWANTVYFNLSGGDHVKLAIEFRSSSDNKTVRGGYSIYSAASGTWGRWVYSPWIDPTAAPVTVDSGNPSNINYNAFDADWQTRWGLGSCFYVETYANNGSAQVVLVDDTSVKCPLVDNSGPPLGPVTFQSEFTGNDGDNISSLAQWSDANGGPGMTKTLDTNQGKFTMDGTNWLYPSVRATQVFNPLTATGARFESEAVKIVDDNNTTAGSNGSFFMLLSDRSDGWTRASCYVPGEKIRMAVDVMNQATGTTDISLGFINNKGTNEWHPQPGVDVGTAVWTQQISNLNLNGNPGISPGDHVKLAVEFRQSADNKTVRGGYSLFNSTTGAWSNWVYSGWFNPTTVPSTDNASDPTHTQIDINAFDADWQSRWVHTNLILEGYAPRLRVTTVLADNVTVQSPLGEIPMNRPYTIDYSDNITVDGFVGEWAPSDWVPLDQIYSGTAWDIAEAYYAVKWGAGGHKIYVAVKVRDVFHIFTDNYTGSDARDAIELYLHTTGVSVDGSYPQAVAAQQLTVGIKDSDRYTVWASLPPGALNPPVNYDYQAAGYEDGQWLYYEVAMTPYQSFGGVSGGATVPSVLATNQIIGFDVTAVSSDDYGYTGMKSENLMLGKYLDYTRFGLHKLTGTAPVSIPGDVNNDGHVNAADLAIVLAAMDSKPPSDARADIDSDGEITSSDLSVVLANME